MKVNAHGHVFDSEVRTETGRSTGYGSLAELLAAFGIPVAGELPASLLVPLRRFADAFDLPHSYQQADNTFYIASSPLPPLPADPVGADVEPWRPVTAPILSGPGDRRAPLLERVIQQFRVAKNPRHAPRDGNTYCNIYLWDVTRALGCEIPHWVSGNGVPSDVGRGRELDANSVIDWLGRQGPDFGWRRCDAASAIGAANLGRPAVAAWYNPGGIGHVAMVRPGTVHAERGVPIAQAGAANFDDGYLVDGFGSAAGAVKYYVHS